MIACEKAVVFECPRHNDDYDLALREFAELADTAYHDSLVLAGLREAEDVDFMRRRWDVSFVARVQEFLADTGDGSAGALSLESALKEAELRTGPRRKSGGVRRFYIVWLGPLARSWLRSHADELRAFLNGRYPYFTSYLGE